MVKHLRKIEYSVYEVGAEFKIINADDKFEEITGYTLEEVKSKGLTQLDLIPKEDQEDYIKLVSLLINKKNEAYIEHRLVRKNGEVIFVFCLGIAGENPETSTFIRIIRMDESLGMLFQQEEFKNKIINLEHDAKTDDLTRLLRRDLFINEVNRLISNKTKFAFMLIDVDKFKNINDTYGHNIGDEVLIKVSDAFSKSVRKNYVIGRMGGDEFAVIVQCTKEEDASKIIDRILKKVSSIKMKNLKDFKVTVSIGIKYFNPEEGISLYDELYVKADEALYKAKKEGRNTFSVSE